MGHSMNEWKDRIRHPQVGRRKVSAICDQLVIDGKGVCVSLGIIVLTVVATLFFLRVPATGASRYEATPEHNDAGLVLVFVHGLSGDSDITWKNEITGAHWPKLIAVFA